MREQILKLIELMNESKIREIDELTSENPELLYTTQEGLFFPEIALKDHKSAITIVFLTKLQETYMDYFKQKDNLHLEKRKLILTRLVNHIFQNIDEEISEDDYLVLLFLVQHKKELHFDLATLGKHYAYSLKWSTIEEYDAFYKGQVRAKTLLWVNGEHEVES